MRLPIRPLFVAVTGIALAVGCQSGPRLAGLNPFFRPEQTTYLTAAKRIAAAQSLAERSVTASDEDRDAAVKELVGNLAGESDPLVRQATLEAIATLKTPLAQKALLASLDDSDAKVREAGCRMLGEQAERSALERLVELARSDESFDVRLAAVRALGNVGAQENQFLAALEDPNPAMQLAGVEAMRKSTGRDLGGDVSAYRALARGETVPEGVSERPAVANRLPSWAKFF